MITTERYIQTLWDSILLNNTGAPGDLATAGYPFDAYDIATLDNISQVNITININGGNNIIAPKAKEAKQHFRRKR